MRNRLSDREKIHQILVLRSQGLSFPKIGHLYGKHHTSIIDICRRNNVTPGSLVLDIDKIVISAPAKVRRSWNSKDPQVIRKNELLASQEEVINQGKRSYKDYLRSAGYIKYYTLFDSRTHKL
jgi:hypothetical protein